MKSIWLIVPALCCLVAETALADEAGGSDAGGQVSFDGAYVGIGLGVASADGTTEYPVLAGGTRFAAFDPGTGQAYGAFAGYNWQRDRFVYGVEIQYINMVRVADRNTGASEAREVMQLADLRGRLGYVHGRMMFYGALGWSWAKFRVHPGSAFAPRPNQTSLTGLNVGLGLDYALSDRWTIGGEYNFRDLKGRFDEASRDTNLNVSNFSIRASYRF